MSVFGLYARYYDLLYRDKNYAEEAQYIHELLQAYAPGCHSLLELGCGTAKHACLLAEKGYQLYGIDQSEEMLTQACEHISTHFPHLASRVTLQQGDIRHIRLHKQFDAIVSLFHVFSYQTGNDDLQAVFQTVFEHLAPDGICVFDFWYGPAVLVERPAVRVKRFEDDQIRATRIAEPEMLSEKNLIKVNYDVLIEEKQTRRLESIHETHSMRYLFVPELEYMLQQNGLTLLSHLKWMSLEPNSGNDCWYSVCIVQKKG